MSDSEPKVLDAAAALVAAFASGDLEAYFACFADHASFVFHSTPQLIESVDDYRRLWASWQRDEDFRVVSCESSARRVQSLGSVAVFTHRVRTRVASVAGEVELHERETIVFEQQPDGRWLAVHEHLSPDPATD